MSHSHQVNIIPPCSGITVSIIWPTCTAINDCCKYGMYWIVQCNTEIHIKHCEMSCKFPHGDDSISFWTWDMEESMKNICSLSCSYHFEILFTKFFCVHSGFTTLPRHPCVIVIAHTNFICEEAHRLEASWMQNNLECYLWTAIRTY